MSDHRIAPDASAASITSATPAATSTTSATHATATSTTPATSATSAAASAPAPSPIAAHEPPYYVVVFTSVRTGEDGGYAETAERMEELVKEVPGYLGMDHARTPGGLSITVGYFRDLAAIEEWRSNLEHRAAQKQGRERWYERYTLHVAKVERSHAFGKADPTR